MSNRTAQEIEAMAEKIYLDKYAREGGRWECVETKDVWREKARNYYRANDFWGAVMGLNSTMSAQSQHAALTAGQSGDRS